MGNKHEYTIYTYLDHIEKMINSNKNTREIQLEIETSWVKLMKDKL